MSADAPTDANAPAPTHAHEQHRVLTIRGKSFCDSACIFCIEKFAGYHAAAPKIDETRRLIVENAGKYNMLFFMNGEPSVNPLLFEHVRLAKDRGFRYFGMSSHFRAFADPYFALKILEAGFTFFDISLHASDFAAQAEVNPLDDGGKSLKEALHGLRNVFAIAQRTNRKIGVTHKAVISRLNYRELLPLFRATYDLGVRNFILQPVKTSGLADEVADRLAINEDEFMPYVNDFLRQTEGMGAKIKLYGMSQLGAYASQDLIQEANLIKHVSTRRGRRVPAAFGTRDQIIPAVQESTSTVRHEVTVQLPGSTQSATFTCGDDQFLLNGALGSGVKLPFGCRMASCGACCGRVIEGEVERVGQGILTDEQVAAGYVLLCKSRPRSKLVIVTHQEEELGL